MAQKRFARAYITGGSGGIGLAIAAQCIARGADVLLIARNPEKLTKAEEKLRSDPVATDRRIESLSLDVSQYAEARKKLEEKVKSFGEPDFLVNCAGIPLALKTEDIENERFRKVIDINLGGTWNVTSVLLPYIRKNRGTIVNVSSMAGVLGVFGYTAYSASKFALIGFSESLRAEVKPDGVQVSVLCPADTETAQLEEERAMMPEETRAVNEGGGVMQPGAVAAALMKGVDRGKFIIVPGLYPRFIYFVKRLLPGFVMSIIDSDIKKAQKKMKAAQKSA